jgi:hypothetical protein
MKNGLKSEALRWSERPKLIGRQLQGLATVSGDVGIRGIV